MLQNGYAVYKTIFPGSFVALPIYFTASLPVIRELQDK
jgi:hypothetical protein